MSHYSSVSVTAGYRLDVRFSIPGREEGFSLLHSVKAGTGAPTQPSAQRVKAVNFQGVKRSRHEADNSLPYSAEVNNGGAIPPPPHIFML
jgi:hypothetical protein